MQHNPVFQETGGLKPGKSAFDLSHVRIFDANIGALIPVYVEDVLPGDVIDLSHVHIIRSQPLVTPLYHRLEVFSHTFFVSYRILFRDWEKFITRGSSGDMVVPLPKFGESQYNVNGVKVKRYGLWDSFGLPIHNPATGIPADDYTFNSAPPTHDLFWRAYWAIWRDFYRDSNHQVNYPNLTGDLITVPVPIGESPDEMLDNLDSWLGKETDGTNSMPCDCLAYRCWQKDYFTSALPWQQRGTAPAIPLQGFGAIDPDSYAISNGDASSGLSALFFKGGSLNRMYFDQADPNVANSINNADNFFRNMDISLTSSGISVADLRVTIQTQKWMERNARGGYRYNEFLAAHFGVMPRDERLQRPEYLGGSRNPVIVSEVLQNSSTDVTSPQGNMAGHAMAVDQAYHGRYRVLEHGVIMTIMSIMPEAIYQTGIPRMFTRETTFDFYSPEFAHLSEAEIKKREVYFSDDGGTVDNARFGFQACWDEYRDRQSIVFGKMASSLNVWHLSRLFTSCPSLNETFLTTKEFSETRRNSWAVPGVVNNSQGQFLCQWRNIVKAIRPLPYISDPGMLDHF